MGYLEKRKQFAQYKHCNSEVLNVCCGVPLVSILGPKLCIMYIIHICNVSKVAKFILFADDTNLFCCDCDLDELIRKTNAEL